MLSLSLRPGRERTEWLLFLGSALVMAGLAGFDLYRDRDAILRGERDRLAHNARVVAGSIGRRIEGIGAGLDILRDSLRTLPGHIFQGETGRERLAGLAATMRGVTAILVVDADTRVTASSVPELLGRSFRGSERDRTMREGLDARAVYLSAPFVTATGRYTITAAKVLLDPTGAFIGFVSATLDPAFFDDLLSAGLYGPADLRLGLVHWDGKVIYRVPVEEGLSGANLLASPGSFFETHRGSGQAESQLDGVSPVTGAGRMTVFRTVEWTTTNANKPLVAYATRDPAALLAPWRKDLAIRSAFGAVLGVVSALGLAILQQRRLALARIEAERQAERRRADEDLRIAEARWNFALEGAGQGVWDWDMLHGTVYYSPIYAQMLGYAPRELGDSAAAGFDRMHPDDLPGLQAAVDAHVRGETSSYVREFRIRRKDGSYVWVESHGKVVERTPEGRPSRMIGTHADITERKRNELVRASEARHRFLIQLNDTLRGLADPDAMRLEASRLLGEHVGADRVGYAQDEGDGVHVDVRRSYARGVDGLEGRYRYDDYGPELLRAFREGRTVVRPDIANDPTLTEVEKAAHAVLSLGSTVNVPLLRDGVLRAILFVHCRVARAWTADEVALFEDVGARLWADIERVRAERALAENAASLRIAKEAAETANVAKTAFLANMSHELRTPLHHIDGFVQLIGMEPLTPRQEERLVRVRSATKHMTTLVDAVLELTRIEAGRLELVEEPLDLQAVVTAAVGKFRDEASRKQLALAVREVPAIPGLAGDAKRIQQALMNYLDNAIRFTRVGSVELRAAPLREDETGMLVRFEVRDTGPGIRPEDQSRLFHIFEQVDNSSTRQYGGLGVGLAITRKIAEALGGEAGCESASGEGSTFWFSVRLKKLPIA